MTTQRKPFNGEPKRGNTAHSPVPVNHARGLIRLTGAALT
jgi:hypothetical protein